MGENDIDMSSVVKLTIDGKEVTQITDSQGRILWEKVDRRDYFYLEDLSGSANEITLTKVGDVEEWVSLEYSYNKQTWTEWDFANDTIPLEANGKVYLRGDNTRMSQSVNSAMQEHNFSSIGNVYAGGNIMSLLDKSIQQTTISNSFAFACLFKNMTTLVGVNPALCDTFVGGASAYRFYQTFYQCINLTNIPNFNGITLGRQEDFSSAFRGTAVVDASNAFNNLESVDGNLTFNSAFFGCTSLVTPPSFSKLSGDLSGNSTFLSTFRGCTSLLRGVDLSGITSLGGNTPLSRMYEGCSSLRVLTAPNIDTWDETKSVDWVKGINTDGFVKVYTIPSGFNAGDSRRPTHFSKTHYNGVLYGPIIVQEENTNTITIKENGGIDGGQCFYYTLDGTTPTTSSTLYTEPFEITQTCTIKAISSNGTGVELPDILDSAVQTFKATYIEPTV